ncbi:Nucleoporin NUP85-like protein [Elsinoe fawcettii]|nr:Nucleoporin NUP85-like protein [Elsinoe fawcettii]
MFQVPSTPDSRRTDNDFPSTTPAGPPPTSFTHQSFTPAGQPPSSVLGSSFGAGNGFNAKSTFSFSQFLKSPSTNAPGASNRLPSNGFNVPSSSPPRRPENDLTNEAAQILAGFGGGVRDANLAVNSVEDMLDFGASPRGAKRSRNGDVMTQSMRSSRAFGRVLDRDSTMPSIASGLAASVPEPGSIEENDDLILSTEDILERLDAAAKSKSNEELDLSLQRSVGQLQQEWSKHKSHDSKSAGIGPVDKSAFSRAAYVASLLFQLHHPTTLDSSPNQARAGAFGALVRAPTSVSWPLALLSWLNKNHNPFPEDLGEVQNARPTPCAHERFWDTIFQTLLRGNLSVVVKLLSTTNWGHADSALEDGYEEPGYTGSQLEAVQHVVAQCVTLLDTCPALTDDDWEVTGTSWALFRNRARRALDDLEEYAESENADRDYGVSNIFSASKSFAAGSRRAESRVPWTIYEQLKAIYGQLLGYKEEILLSAQDWLEAVIYLAVWWDGDDEQNLGASRRGTGRVQRERLVDMEPGLAYRRRLLGAFAAVTDEPEDAVLGVNTTDPVQVALGAVFEGEVESVLKIVSKMSPLVAASIVDIASVGGWLPDSRPRTGDVMDGFDAEDLMVLSHGNLTKGSTALDRDSILTTFSSLLAKKQTLHSPTQDIEGWTLSVRVLSRLDSATKAQDEITRLFNTLPLDSASQVDKALSVCASLGLDAQVRAISARYAAKLSKEGQSYGEALLYYARAHDAKELQATLDVLLATSLVGSAAWPARGEMDAKLEELVGDQVRIVGRLAGVDREAGRLLASGLSGYASLRRFYELRDEEVEDDGDEEMADAEDASVLVAKKKSGLRPKERRKEMVRSIVALVDSAATSIRGGLYDAEARGVVQVDALLALLGEALGLLHQPQTTFSKRQLMTLLRAIEDLQTISSRIYDQAESLFQACMGAYSGAISSSQQDLAKSIQLQKSTSNLSTSTYGMVNSRGSIESEKTGSKEGPSEDKIKRAWDWRRGVAMSVGTKAKGADVLRILRVGIAKEVGRGWAEGR